MQYSSGTVHTTHSHHANQLSSVHTHLTRVRMPNYKHAENLPSYNYSNLASGVNCHISLDLRVERRLQQTGHDTTCNGRHATTRRRHWTQDEDYLHHSDTNTTRLSWTNVRVNGKSEGNATCLQASIYIGCYLQALKQIGLLSGQSHQIVNLLRRNITRTHAHTHTHTTTLMTIFQV